MMEVQFPGLGLDFKFNNWAFEVFGIKIFWYGILIAAAFLAAVLLAMRSSKKYGIEQESILDLVLFTAPAAIICARLYYVIFSWDQFKGNLLEVFNTRNGGLAVYGGVIGAFIVAWFFARYKKIPFLHLLDFGVPYLALGQAIGRWGNFVNQEAFGAVTSLPWRMNGNYINSYIGGISRSIDLTKNGVHPTFLYESLWDFALFLFLANYRKKKKVEGEVLYLYLILYGVGRFFIEGLRTDSLMLGSLRVSQMLSLLLVLVFVSLFVYGRRKKKQIEEEEPVDLGQSQYGALLMKMKEEENAADKADVGDEGAGMPDSGNTAERPADEQAGETGKQDEPGGPKKDGE